VGAYSTEKSGRKSMSNEFASNIHIYKPKRWTLTLNIFSLFFIGIVMGIPLIAFVLMIVSFFRAERELNTFAIFFGCLLTPIIILLVFNIIQMTVSVIMSFFSYVKISPDGIVQKNSPYKHIRCNWPDVDKLGKFFLLTDVIYLNSFEVLGFSLSLKSPFRFLRPKQGFIALTGYEGWPDGQLANDLKQYAPKLFENQPIPQENQLQTKEVQAAETSSISQEVRLLAAISHASVIFPNIGFFVPIGIYLTQKKKSSYLGFQSLQALIWQIVMFVFTILTSSCMVGSMLIPVLLATASQNERLIGLSGGGIFIGVSISVSLMTFGNLAFVIYGIIGAAMTYQGKDFRYVVIGNRLGKSRGAKPTISA
jgi:uncharacterized Tic20 family protein